MQTTHPLLQHAPLCTDLATFSLKKSKTEPPLAENAPTAAAEPSSTTPPSPSSAAPDLEKEVRERGVMLQSAAPRKESARAFSLSFSPGDA